MRVTDDTFYTMTESIHTTGGCDSMRSMNGEFTIEDDMPHVKSDKDRRTLDAACIDDDGGNGDLCACAGGRRHHDKRKCSSGEYLQQLGTYRATRAFDGSGDHLRGVEDRTAAEGDDRFGMTGEGSCATGFDKRDRGFRCYLIIEGVLHSRLA